MGCGEKLMITPPAEIYVVINEHGESEFSASWPDACHEHINDAIMDGDTAAAQWVVRKYVLSTGGES